MIFGAHFLNILLKAKKKNLSFSIQIKTTSPEKFRVRPSTGILTPGSSVTINVVLQPGPNVTLLLNKDKFLVMCMEMTDLNTSQHDIAELWKVS